MVIYADIVFLVNFMFNVVLLFALYKFRSRKIRPLRLMAAAFLGGGLGVAVLIPYLQPFLSAASRYILPFLMGAICFMPCSLKTVLFAGIYIFTISFVFAGLMEFFGTSAISGFFMLIPLSIVYEKIKKVSWKKHRQTELMYKGNKVVTEGFLDSGNLLNYNGVPVILAKHKIFESLFGKGFSMSAPTEWIDATDFRYVSYSAIGKSGVIPGVLIDSAVIDGKVFDKVILAYLGENFSEQVILASSMI